MLTDFYPDTIAVVAMATTWLTPTIPFALESPIVWMDPKPELGTVSWAAGNTPAVAVDVAYNGRGSGAGSHSQDGDAEKSFAKKVHDTLHIYVEGKETSGSWDRSMKCRLPSVSGAL
jgi:hypothetical protein